MDIFSALAETLAGVHAERERAEDPLWRAQAQIEGFTIRLYRLRERFNCWPAQLLLPFADDPELEAELKAAAEQNARFEEIVVRRRVRKRWRRLHISRTAKTRKHGRPKTAAAVAAASATRWPVKPRVPARPW